MYVHGYIYLHLSILTHLSISPGHNSGREIALAEKIVTNFTAKLVIACHMSFTPTTTHTGNNAEHPTFAPAMIETMDLSVLKENYILPLLGLDTSCYSCFEHGKKDMIHRFLEARKANSFEDMSLEVGRGISALWLALNEEETLRCEPEEMEYFRTQAIWKLIVMMLNRHIDKRAGQVREISPHGRSAYGGGRFANDRMRLRFADKRRRLGP